MTRTPVDARNEYRALLARLLRTSRRVVAVSGNRQPLSFPDWHLLSEGVLLTAWSSWEAYLRQLFILDLATDTAGVLRRDIRAAGFRYTQSPLRLAEAIVDHPDPSRFVEWSRLGDIKGRANSLLGPTHRYGAIPPARETTIEHLVKVRNAIAHNSDTAWDKFSTLIRNAPYTLTPSQRRGITVGRFLTSHRVGGRTVLHHFLHELGVAACDLVP